MSSRSQRHLPAALVLLSLVAGAPRARAEGDLSGSQPALSTQAAQAHYEAGSVYYEQGQYERAVEEFLLAQRDDDRPALDYNLGICWSKLGDSVRAATAYRRFLTREPSSPHRDELQATIATLEARTAELVIRSRVEGARHTLDGRVIESGAPVRVNAGSHELVAAKEGYRSASAVITVGPGTRLETALDPIAPRSHASRRRALALGLGITGGVVLVGTAVALGVVFGTRGFDAHPAELGSIVVRP